MNVPKRCICEFDVTPCNPNCSCANPLASGGCRRCVTYGSLEQQEAQAKVLVSKEEWTEARIKSLQDSWGLMDDAITRAEALEKASAKLLEAWDSLPGVRYYTAEEMSDWLLGDMSLAISKLRDIIEEQ